MVDYTGRFARELHVVGLVNVQYAVQRQSLRHRGQPAFLPYRAVYLQGHRCAHGRSGVRCMPRRKAGRYGLRHRPAPQRQEPLLAVKVPVFSFLKLHGVDTLLGPEMKSTGEVLGIAPNFHEAMIKGLVAAGYQFKTPAPVPA